MFNKKRLKYIRVLVTVTIMHLQTVASLTVERIPGDVEMDAVADAENNTTTC